MARQLNRLTNLSVDRAKRPGMYADGLGLYLRVAPGGSKQWVFRFRPTAACEITASGQRIR
jgi:hypothetical protein